MIETDRLILRPMADTDFGDVFRIFTDEEVMQSFGGSPFSQQQMWHWMNENLGHQREYGYGLFSVILKANGQLIGDCGLEHTVFNDKPCVEIGYDLLSDYWNQGYATEAATAVKNYATNSVRIDRGTICSLIRRHNKASVRVSEKIGMERLQEFERSGTEYYLYGFSTEYFG